MGEAFMFTCWESVSAQSSPTGSAAAWGLPPEQGYRTVSTVEPREMSKFLFSNPDLCFWARASLPFPVMTRNGRQRVRRDQQGAQLQSVFWRPLTMRSGGTVSSLRPKGCISQRERTHGLTDAQLGAEMWINARAACSKSSKMCPLP